MRNWIQHKFNCGHLYCRFVEFGISRKNTIRILTILKFFINPIIYKGV